MLANLLQAEILLLVIINGIYFGGYLFLLSMGLAITTSTLRLFNLSHGVFYALGGYIFASTSLLLYQSGMPLTVLVGLAMMVTVVTAFTGGLFIEKVFLRHVYKRHEFYQLLLTFGLLLVFQDLILIVWGPSPIKSVPIYERFPNFSFGVFTYSAYSIFIPFISLLIMLALLYFTKKTVAGKILLAVASDPEICECLGLRVNSYRNLAFGLGAILASLGGSFFIVTSAAVPGLGVEALVVAFSIIAISGLGSISGIYISSIIVGLTRSLLTMVIPELELFIVYLVVMLILLLKPSGLFGREVIRV